MRKTAPGKRRRRLRILITTGPTREYIDPVRYISNPSTGKIGFELAQSALKRCHKVTLISGRTQYLPPKGAKFVGIETGRELKTAVFKNLHRADVLIMASAVTDFKPARFMKEKVKKKGSLNLRLVETDDILGSLPRAKKGLVKVGFALETRDVVKNAVKKLKSKSLDFIIVNKIAGRKTPFGDVEFDYYIIGRKLRKVKLNGINKRKLAAIILDKAESLCYRNFTK